MGYNPHSRGFPYSRTVGGHWAADGARSLGTGRPLCGRAPDFPPHRIRCQPDVSRPGVAPWISQKGPPTVFHPAPMGRVQVRPTEDGTLRPTGPPRTARRILPLVPTELEVTCGLVE